jgi:glycosyltransferase involved in cell wall biosynthesis
LEKNRVEAIVSTSPPIVTHLIASKLKRKYKIPWIADFRDPWTQKYIDSKMEVIKFFERRLEKRTISSADILVSVSTPYVDKIGSFHEGKRIYCVTNGFDPDEFPGLPRINEKLRLPMGTLYNGRRDPSLLFEAGASC